MAFAKQYFSSYKSNNNLDYYLEIWVDGFDSSATEISVGAGGPVISYETDQEDRFSPILSSQCVLPFVVKDTSTQAFIQQLRTTYKERQVYLHLYRATSSTYTTTKPIWSGFLVMDLGSGEDVSFPYEQKLTFVDGLSLLKDIDFVDLSDTSTPPGDTIPLNERIQGNYDRLNMYYGPAVYTFWIKEILAKAGIAISGVDGQGVSIDYGFTTAVNWYNADMQNTNQGSDPLGLTQCVVSMFHNKNDQDVFTPENCYTVLKELLRHWGARITYWKHEFWIVQIPEYIQDESGLIDNPDNINSRQYNRFGTLTGSQDHLGDTYYTRYEQTIQSNQVSKLVGTKYNYLPMIHNAEADFLSFASKNYYGGFPYGVSAESQEIFQGTIIDPSTANFLWLSIPLNWTWDMTGSSLTDGHEGGWWCSLRFNFYASDGTTTYYLQYDSSNQGSYYWVDSANWTPLGNASPKYIIKSNSLTETNYVGFQQSIPFVDSSGSAITMTGAWSFFLDIEDFANQSSSGNNGSFFCRFSGYQPSSHYSYVKKNPYQEFPYLPTSGNVSGSGPQTKSGKVSWSNTLENPSGITTTSFSTPVSFDAGTTQADIHLVTTSPFKGLLQTLNTTQTSSFGLSLNTQVNNSTNTEKFSFGTLLWGDAIQQFAVGCLRVNNGTAFVKTNPDGEWGRGTLTGTNTFTELLIDEFLSGQIKVVIAPTMRLAVGEENKNQTATGTGGPATRPRYVNPIGRLREFRSNETDPEYIFRRGSFHSLYDEWDYEGYQILRDTVSSTTTTTDIGDLGGTQDNKPISNAKMIGNVNNALMMNSPVAYLRTTVPATGSNVAVNGNFNTAVGWTLGTGWSIDTTAKKAKFAATGSTSELTQSVLTQGLTYQVNFQVVVTAGTLLVKAGTSGTSQSITTSGDYSLYLDCDGSNLIKFQAGTTFTGNITYITLRDQKSISSVPINSIGSTVFKSGDTFNLINSLGGEILPLTVSSNQGATDDTISVTSTALFDDIGIDSVLLINQDDLSAQYQNKTKGTVAGFGIDTDGISKGGIEITGWLNSDTMSGAAVTNVPTALSVKNYVDGQVGASDTLAEVLANGNTTGGTNVSVNDNDKITFGTSADLEIYHNGGNSYIDDSGTGLLYIRGDVGINMAAPLGGEVYAKFVKDAGCEFRFNDSKKLETTNTGISITGGGVFTGQVTIPATPVASTDAASKGYVDAQVGASDTLQEVTDNGNTTTNAITFAGGTSTGNITGENITLGDGSADKQLKVFYSDGSFISYKGYAIEFNRANSYIIPTVTNSKNIYIGNNTLGYWNQIEYNAVTHKWTNASAEKMRLTSGGNLGVSTTNPSEKLSVSGNIAVTNGAGVLIGGAIGDTKIGKLYNVSGVLSLDGDGTRSIRFGSTSNGEVMRVDNTNQRIGIGTSSPSSKLDVFRGSTNGLVAHFSGTKADRGLEISTFQSSNHDAGVIFNAKDVSHGLITFQTGGSEKARITKSGRLLIGTTTEVTNSGTVQIVNSTTYQALLTLRNTGTDSSNDIYMGYNRDNSTGSNGWSTGIDSTDNAFHISEDADSINNNVRLKIAAGGNATFTGQVTIPATPVASTDAASKSYVDAQVSATDSLQEVTTVGNTTTNSIMIGSSSSPTEKLHVVGDALITGDSHADAFKPAASGEPIKFKNFGSTERVQITNDGDLRLTTAHSNGNYRQLSWANEYVGLYRYYNNLMLSGYDSIQFKVSGADIYSQVEKMRLTSGGELCVGYTSNQGLTAKFLVNGNAYFSGDILPAGGIKIEDGSSSAPSIKFNNDTDTGLFRDTANSVGVAGGLNVTGNVLLGITVDSGKKLQINGDIKIHDSANSAKRIFFERNSLDIGSLGTNNSKLTLKSLDNKDISIEDDSGNGLIVKNGGNVIVGGTTDSGVYKFDVIGKARVQSVLELDDVLTLNQISTPADPASGKSSIYMDSADGAIKCKINVGGTVVTRTLASFE